MSLIIATGPTAEPVTLAEVKARLGLTSTVDDAKITQQITAAREFAEKETRRSLCVKSYTLVLDRFPYLHEPIRLPVPPLVSVTTITFLDSTLTPQTWDPTEYFVAAKQSPALIVPVPGNVYPCPVRVPGAVEIDFIAGFGADGGQTIPQHLQEGIRELAVHFYEHPSVVTSEGLKEIPSGFTNLFRANKVYVF